MASGVSDSDTSVATRSPDGEAERRLRADLVDRADQHAAGAGDRVLHLAAGGDDVEHLGADRVPSPRVLLSSCRNDAASRLSLSTAIRTSSGQSSGSGVEPVGRLRQHPARRRAPGAGRPGGVCVTVKNSPPYPFDTNFGDDVCDGEFFRISVRTS